MGSLEEAEAALDRLVPFDDMVVLNSRHRTKSDAAIASFRYVAEMLRHSIQQHRANHVGSDVGRTAIKGQFTPAAAERGQAPVAVLQIEEPANRIANRGAGFV